MSDVRLMLPPPRWVVKKIPGDGYFTGEKKSWTPEEDKKLIRCVAEFGEEVDQIGPDLPSASGFGTSQVQ
jgi:hypothetical protein